MTFLIKEEKAIALIIFEMISGTQVLSLVLSLETICYLFGNRYVITFHRV